MNKEFKTILLLGLVSILISGIWLYQFRNVKFKNTKELEKANQAKQEKLIQEYNELVDVYIPTITDKLPENDLITTGTITMIIPWFLENKWFYTISDKLKQENINLYIKKITSYQEYQNEIKSIKGNFMELNEYYVKEILKNAGLPVLPGGVAYTEKEVEDSLLNIQKNYADYKDAETISDKNTISKLWLEFVDKDGNTVDKWTTYLGETEFNEDKFWAKTFNWKNKKEVIELT